MNKLYIIICLVLCVGCNFRKESSQKIQLSITNDNEFPIMKQVSKETTPGSETYTNIYVIE